MATRRKPPKVEPRDSCFAGVTISAIFRPGEKIDSSGVGSVGSSCTATANAKKPASDPRIAGRIRRNSRGLSIRLKSSKQLGGRILNFESVDGCARHTFRMRRGDAFGISDVWVGLGLNPALSERAATGWHRLRWQWKIVGDACGISAVWVGR